MTQTWLGEALEGLNTQFEHYLACTFNDGFNAFNDAMFFPELPQYPDPLVFPPGFLLTKSNRLLCKYSIQLKPVMV